MVAAWNSCCSNTACILVIIVASSYLRSWITSARSVVFWVLLWHFIEVSTSVSIALDGWDLIVAVVARVAMAVLNCSTAVVIIVLSLVSSCLINTSSEAYSLLDLLSALYFKVL